MMMMMMMTDKAEDDYFKLSEVYISQWQNVTITQPVSAYLSNLDMIIFYNFIPVLRLCVRGYDMRQYAANNVRSMLERSRLSLTYDITIE